MIKVFKYVYVLPFILSCIYIFIYPLINKIFKLNLKTDYTAGIKIKNKYKKELSK